VQLDGRGSCDSHRYRGKSGLHRTSRQITSGRRETTESATENRPPMASHKLDQARVKRRGKSSPHTWQHVWHGKPRLEQGRIGGEGWFRPDEDTAGRPLEGPSNRTPRGMTVRTSCSVRQNPAYRLHFDNRPLTVTYRKRPIIIFRLCTNHTIRYSHLPRC